MMHIALEYIHRTYSLSSSTYVYTNGSKTMKSSHFGANLPSIKTTIHAKLSQCNILHGSRLAAIKAAMKHISRQTPNLWVIFVDSKCAPLTISSMNKQSLHLQLTHLTLQIRQTASVQGHDIVLQ